MKRIWLNLSQLPIDFWLVLTTPARLRSIASRAIESLVGLGVFLVCLHLGAGLYWSAGLSVLAEILYFDGLAEPLGLSGRYWERGPVEGGSWPGDDEYSSYD